MKIKENYTLKKIADVWSVIPLGDAASDFSGILTLNESGHLLWERLESGATREELANALLDEYDVTYEEAFADVSEFVALLEKIGCIEA